MKKIRQRLFCFLGIIHILFYLCSTYGSDSWIMKNTFLPIYIWIFLFFFVLNSCSDREERRILIVHSYEESYVGYPDFNRLIDKEFRRNGVNADIRIVYLDCEAFQEKHF